MTEDMDPHHTGDDKRNHEIAGLFTGDPFISRFAGTRQGKGQQEGWTREVHEPYLQEQKLKIKLGHVY